MSQPESSPEFTALYITWRLYRTYAATSRKIKKTIQQWRLIVFSLTVLGAILGTLSQQLATPEPGLPIKILGTLGAIFIALAAYFSKEILGSTRELNWIQARSAAEKFKSDSFLYATRTQPYDAENAAEILSTRTYELEETIKELPTEIITSAEKTRGILADQLSVEDYIQQRINSQIDDFYIPAAAKNHKIVKRYEWLRIGFGVVGIILGALNWIESTAGWIAVVSTITAALAAHLYAGRHIYLELSYKATARRLEVLRDQWYLSKKSKTDQDALILACENAISIENSSWLAKWSSGSKMTTPASSPAPEPELPSD